MSATLDEVTRAADALLEPHRFEDYCPNGLQVQGRKKINKIVSGVTANLQFIEAAIRAGADVLFVHHGCFWHKDSPALTGAKYARIAALVRAEVGLLAYHLPLDAHPELGNNAQLAEELGLEATGPLEPGNPANIGLVGRLKTPRTAGAFAAHLEARLGRAPTHIGDPQKTIARIAWCTGGAQGWFPLAVSRGVDAYLTGEISEQNTHDALENNMHFFAAGHHATERGGARAVGEFLAKRLGLEHEFIDIPNPA